MVRAGPAATLHVFEKHQQLFHRHAPAFIRHVLDSFMAYLPKSTDADVRTRLAQVLREVVQRISVRMVDNTMVDEVTPWRMVKQVEVSFRMPGIPALKFDLVEPRRKR